MDGKVHPMYENFSPTEIFQEEYHEIKHKGRGRRQVAPSEG